MATPTETSKSVVPVITKESRKLIDQALITFKGLYRMDYRKDSSITSLVFVHDGDLKSARERSFRYCQVMGYRQIWVSAMITDIDAIEETQMERRDGGGNTVNMGHPASEITNLKAGLNAA